MWMEAWGMPFAVQLKSTNYLHFVDVELLNFFLISWKYLPFFHRRGNVSSDCQHAPSFVSFFFCRFLVENLRHFTLGEEPPLCEDPCCQPRPPFVHGYKWPGGDFCPKSVHQQNSISRIFTRESASQNHRNTHNNMREIQLERNTKKYAFFKLDVGLISKIALRFFHMKCSKLPPTKRKTLVGSIWKWNGAKKDTQK